MAIHASICGIENETLKVNLNYLDVWNFYDEHAHIKTQSQ